MSTDQSNTNENKSPQETKVQESPKELKVFEQRDINNGLTEQRRKEIAEYIVSTGSHAPPVKALAAKYKVSERTIYKDVAKIIREMPAPVVEEVGKKLGLSFLTVINKGHKLMLHEDPKIQIDGAKLILDAGEKYVKLLEDFGLKDKIIPKIRIEQTTISITQQIQEFKHTMAELDNLPEDKQRAIRKLILGPEIIDVEVQK